MPRNNYMANKGKVFEEIIKSANRTYELKEIALIQKISTPWNVVRKGKQIVRAYPEEKSTLDFRGTMKGDYSNQLNEYPMRSISFDAKETDHEEGLPMINIEPHQVDYMEKALKVGETTFLLVNSTKHRKYYMVPGDTVVALYRLWEENKGKRGYNKILFEDMVTIKNKVGITIDYLQFFRPTPFKGVNW